MPRLDDLARARFAAVTLLDRRLSEIARRFWALLDPVSTQASFEQDVLPPVLTAMVQTQETAAEVGGLYANQAALAQGMPAGPRIVAKSLAGVASSGGNLVKVLAQPLVSTYAQGAAGAAWSVAKAAGADLMDEIVTTQVHDAARAAELAVLAGNSEVAGYIRIIEPGACSRCIVMAGKFYKWNSGFRRHPQCRCHHELRHSEMQPQHPKELFDAMDRDEQDAAFGKAGAESIRQGADISQVVNVRQGMSTATVAGQTVQTTTVGTGLRSYNAAVQRRIAGERGVRFIRKPRLMPEEILRQAGNDRDLARRLLISNGYIVGDIRALAQEAIALSIPR